MKVAIEEHMKSDKTNKKNKRLQLQKVIGTIKINYFIKKGELIETVKKKKKKKKIMEFLIPEDILILIEPEIDSQNRFQNQVS